MNGAHGPPKDEPPTGPGGGTGRPSRPDAKVKAGNLLQPARSARVEIFKREKRLDVLPSDVLASAERRAIPWALRRAGDQFSQAAHGGARVRPREDP